MRISRLLVFILFILKAGIAPAQRCDTVAFHGFYWSKDHAGIVPARMFLKGDGSAFLLSQSGGPFPDGFPESGEVNLTLLSARGNPLWSRNFGFDGSIEQPMDGALAADGGVFFCGTYGRANPYGDGWVAKVSAAGNLEWSRAFIGKAVQLVTSVATADGGFIVAGHIYDDFTGGGYGNIVSVNAGRMLLFRLTPQGNLVWAKTYTSRPISQATALTQMADGSLLVTGVTREVTINSDADREYFVMKLDAGTGTAQWTVRLDDIGYGPSNLRSDAKGAVQVWSSNRLQVFDANGANTANVLFDTPDSLLGPVHVVHRFDPVTGEHYGLYDIFRSSVVLKFHDFQSLDRSLHFAYSGSLGFNLPGYDLGLYNGKSTIVTDLISSAFPDGTQLPAALGWPYLYQTDLQGKTPCSDTFNHPIQFVSHPLLPLHSMSFNETPFRDTGTNVPLVRNISFARKFDCFTNTCCRDTLIYKDTTLCEGQSLALPDGSRTSTPGVYTFSYQSPKGCDSIIYVSLAFTSRKSISLGADTCLTGSSAIIYDLSAVDSVSLLWENGDTSRVRTIRQPGTYWLKASFACNLSIDTVLIAPSCDTPPYIPNSFTPNGDGLNDIFRIPNLHGQRLNYFNIYDRYGSRIFTTSDPSRGWNGTVKGARAPIGTYIYHIEYVGLDGKPHRLKGTITVVR